MPTNTRESGLETLIVSWLVDKNSFEHGISTDYNREYAVDESRLLRFLENTQPDQSAKLGLKGDTKRIQFLDRLRGEIAITYAYESVSRWDKEKKQSRCRRTLVGRLDYGLPQHLVRFMQNFENKSAFLPPTLNPCAAPL
jgi:RNA recognition motif-containing protein